MRKTFIINSPAKNDVHVYSFTGQVLKHWPMPLSLQWYLFSGSVYVMSAPGGCLNVMAPFSTHNHKTQLSKLMYMKFLFTRIKNVLEQDTLIPD